jgi:hypothetical protein
MVNEPWLVGEGLSTTLTPTMIPYGSRASKGTPILCDCGKMKGRGRAMAEDEWQVHERVVKSNE